MRLSLLLLLLAGGCSRATEPPPPASTTTTAKAPLRIAGTPFATTVAPRDDGRLVVLEGKVYRPSSPKPPSGYPVVVFNHGSPLDAAARPRMTPDDYWNAIEWFADRGYIVVAGMRRGFGTSGGKFTEGVSCEKPDYLEAGRVAGHDIRAMLDYVPKIPDVDLDRVVVAGHSAGGFGSIALLAEDGAKVRAAISFAGGKGAPCLKKGAPFTDDIVAAAGAYGHVSVPSLWIYAANDSFFAPAIADRMFAAYHDAGAPAQLEHLPATGADGHALFTPAARALWTPAAERFLLANGLPSRS